MAPTGDKPRLDELLKRLSELLGDASTLADELVRDAVLRRLIEAFRLMPLEDRDVIVDAIEHEVQARRLSLATEATTGQSMHPNPHARLYLRAHENVIPRGLLERDELMLAMLRGMRVAPLLRVPAIHDAWVEGTREALEHIDDATRGVVAGLLREVLALVEAVPSESTTDKRASTG